MRLPSLRLLRRSIMVPNSACHNLSNIQQLRRVRRNLRQGVPKHRVAERTCSGNRCCTGRCQLLCALDVYAFADLLAEKHSAASGTATEGTLFCSRRVVDAFAAYHLTRCFGDSAISRKIAGIMKGYLAIVDVT